MQVNDNTPCDMVVRPGRCGKPVSADLLRLFGPWLTGVRLAAGECMLSREPASARLLGQPCGHPGCRSVICGPTDERVAANLANHWRRCHPRPATAKQKESRS